MEQAEVNTLIEKYINGTASPAEEKQLLEWYRSADHRVVEVPVDNEDEPEQLRTRMLHNLQAHIAGTGTPATVIKTKRKNGWLRAAAAVFIILSGVAGYLLWQPGSANKTAATTGKQIINDLPAGGNKAMLTLADGSVIVLDSAANGTVAQQGNTQIIKSDSGQLVYTINSYEAISVPQFNTILTPRGGQYKVVLPDGSVAWLNAASSLRFPTAFTGKERLVELTGEGYFEVKKDASKTFIVSLNENTTVKVLGTIFNINAYRDEPFINTTLLQGKVNISSGNNQAVLKPGQAAEIATGKTQIIIAANADTEAAIAWKEGFFKLTMADLQTVMRQVARWYDVEIVYKDSIPVGHIVGTVSRNMSLSNVLKLLEVSGVHCSLNGRVLTVSGK